MKRLFFFLIVALPFFSVNTYTSALDSARSAAKEVDEILEQVEALLYLTFDTTPGVLDEYDFPVPYFENVSRKVRVYRPANFSDLSSYSVVYMQDGQNLYEDSTSFAGEWQVDELLDSLRVDRGTNYIVVGIDNLGEKRMQEYNPFDNEKFGKGYGKEYVDWIVNTLVPSIDSLYPTHATPYSRAIMGSSMGGLISHYALLRYPNVFGAAGIFSPSYWICDKELTEFENQFPLQPDQLIYMLVGGKEGRSMKKLSKKHISHLQKQQPNSQSVKLVFDKNGMHNERFWTAYLADAFLFLLKE